MKAKPKTDPIVPKAAPLFSGAIVSPINALATGKIPPAPNPWIILPKSKTLKLNENAVIKDPKPNKTILNM